MEKVIKDAKNSGVFRWNYVTCTDNNHKNGAWQQEKFATIYTYCLKAILEITRNSDDLTGNILIGSPGSIAALESIDGFEVFHEVEYDAYVQRVGKIGRFIVYRNILAVEEGIVVAKTTCETIDTIVGSRYIYLDGMGASGLI